MLKFELNSFKTNLFY